MVDIFFSCFAQLSVSSFESPPVAVLLCSNGKYQKLRLITSASLGVACYNYSIMAPNTLRSSRCPSLSCAGITRPWCRADAVAPPQTRCLLPTTHSICKTNGR